jgi:hypothetical protein
MYPIIEQIIVSSCFHTAFDEERKIFYANIEPNMGAKFVVYVLSNQLDGEFEFAFSADRYKVLSATQVLHKVPQKLHK